MCLVEALRRLHDNDSPLLLSLAWSEEHEKGLDCKQFVLKEMHSDVVQVFMESIWNHIHMESMYALFSAEYFVL